MTIDPITAAWTRNVSDERAARNGCTFDVERAAYVVFWIERYCRLYEGEQAGEPLTLRGCHSCGSYDLPPSHEFDTWEDARAIAIERAERYAACVAAGHAVDWQYECVMRLFGWVKFSQRWQRNVRRFIQAIVFIAKKNKKTPQLAALGLYLTAGDGEPGQHVYFGAKDGKQARIACEHVRNMLLQSPELAAEFKLNENTMRMSHLPSRSYMEPLSSGNSRHQQGKEGLNGSVCIDETHVVDREFVSRLARMGISRSEPLQVEVSTAGTDPESYGKSRFDLAERVTRGDYEGNELEHIFAAVYAAPQTLTDAELAADPVKYGRMANPAWGHTVADEEYLRDYHASKHTLADLAKFKLYRLNIWQASESPWLDMLAWAECRRDFAFDDLIGLPCAAGLDLAKTRDTCALTLVCWDEATQAVRQWAFIWVPRERALALQDKVSYLAWGAAGHIILTEGNTADYLAIENKIVELCGKLQMRYLIYDDLYAAQMVQRLVEVHGVLDLDAVVDFGQTVINYAGPTDDYEAHVLERRLHHPGNPCLTWQAGNAKVRVDVNHGKRPVKQKHGDVRTIDAIAGGVMALSKIEQLKEEAGGWYSAGSLRD